MRCPSPFLRTIRSPKTVPNASGGTHIVRKTVSGFLELGTAIAPSSSQTTQTKATTESFGPRFASVSSTPLSISGVPSSSIRAPNPLAVQPHAPHERHSGRRLLLFLRHCASLNQFQVGGRRGPDTGVFVL